MNHSEQISETTGYTVVAHQEGALLGAVVHVFFDPDSRSISGMTLKSRIFGKESWFAVDEIELFGKDVILLKSEASLTPLAESGVVKGKSLNEMRGMPVVTVDGEELGSLEDCEVRGENWSLSELYLNRNRRLPVDSNEIKMGPDQIIVPAGYTDRIIEKPPGSPGFLSRVFTAKEEQAFAVGERPQE